ncbi:MAG: RMD1 family protein [Gammaproteobacteria bacterium]|nr:RMD1 family protein [Gammaproteobacteria bacterium]
MSNALPQLQFQAFYLGARIDTRELEKQQPVLRAPLMLRRGSHGHAVVFRFGAVVLVAMSATETEEFLAEIEAFVINPPAHRSSEMGTARIGEPDGIDCDGYLGLVNADPGRLQVVAATLAKSVVLAHYEDALSRAFDRVEIIVENLRRGGRGGKDRELLSEIGEVLATQARMVGRVEVAEKPESAWDSLELDRLYEKLAAEYELRDRDRALTRKLEVVAETAHTQLDLLYSRRTLRVEWYIVLLIVFDIVLSLGEKLF